MRVTEGVHAGRTPRARRHIRTRTRARLEDIEGIEGAQEGLHGLGVTSGQGQGQGLGRLEGVEVGTGRTPRARRTTKTRTRVRLEGTSIYESDRGSARRKDSTG